ncbi:MAG: hypothetical protein H7306_12085 [Bacteriovorax sp.]|nr:hypothetical protein [Rhizobacter sp.]
MHNNALISLIPAENRRISAVDVLAETCMITKLGRLTEMSNNTNFVLICHKSEIIKPLSCEISNFSLLF